MKIGLVLAEILRISKLDWRDGGGKGRREGGKGRRRGGILLCNGLIDNTCVALGKPMWLPIIFLAFYCKGGLDYLYIIGV